MYRVNYLTAAQKLALLYIIENQWCSVSDLCNAYRGMTMLSQNPGSVRKRIEDMKKNLNGAIIRKRIDGVIKYYARVDVLIEKGYLTRV